MFYLSLAVVSTINATLVPKSYELPFAKQVTTYLTAKEWPEVFELARDWTKPWCKFRPYVTMVMIRELNNRSYVKLCNTADMHVSYRLMTGEMKDQGHGRVIFQDLFTRGGRAAWALSEMYDLNHIPELNAGLSKAEWNKRAKQIAGFITPESLKLRKQVVAYLKIKEWPELQRIAQAWTKLPKADRVHLATMLLPYISRRETVELRNTGDLIILYRWDTGDLKVRPAGQRVEQDLFIKGGRAAWALAQLFPDVKLPELNDGMSREEWYKRTKVITERINEAMTK